MNKLNNLLELIETKVKLEKLITESIYSLSDYEYYYLNEAGVIGRTIKGGKKFAKKVMGDKDNLLKLNNELENSKISSSKSNKDRLSYIKDALSRRKSFQNNKIDNLNMLDLNKLDRSERNNVKLVNDLKDDIFNTKYKSVAGANEARGVSSDLDFLKRKIQKNSNGADDLNLHYQKETLDDAIDKLDRSGNRYNDILKTLDRSNNLIRDNIEPNVIENSKKISKLRRDNIEKELYNRYARKSYKNKIRPDDLEKMKQLRKKEIESKKKIQDIQNKIDNAQKDITKARKQAATGTSVSGALLAGGIYANKEKKEKARKSKLGYKLKNKLGLNDD